MHTIFLDRDGIINDVVVRDSGISSPRSLDEFILREDFHACYKGLLSGRFRLFVVSNQSGIARGFFDIAFVQKTHITLDAMLQSHGIFIKQWYFCPHHPSEGINKEFIKDCSCRKPKPGMLLQAAQEHDLDLSRSLLFGDQESDLCAGRAAGCTVYNIAHYANKGR